MSTHPSHLFRDPSLPLIPVPILRSISPITHAPNPPHPPNSCPLTAGYGQFPTGEYCQPPVPGLPAPLAHKAFPQHHWDLANEPQRARSLFSPSYQLNCPDLAPLTPGFRDLGSPAGSLTPAHSLWAGPESLWLLSWCKLRSPRAETLPSGKPYLSAPRPGPIGLETPSWRRPQLCGSWRELLSKFWKVAGQPPPSCRREASWDPEPISLHLPLYSAPGSLLSKSPFPWPWRPPSVFVSLPPLLFVLLPTLFPPSDSGAAPTSSPSRGSGF